MYNKTFLFILFTGLFTFCFQAQEFKSVNQLFEQRFDTTKATPITLESGLKIFKYNTVQGPKPSQGSKVSAHYTGYLTNNSKFDSSLDRGKAFKFTIGEHKVIKAWEEAFLYLSKTEYATIVVPPHLGYGKRSIPGLIPAGSTLIFDIYLQNFK